MELAREVTGTEEGGLRGFLRSWDRQGHARSIVAGGGRDAVQVMTVHKAKGWHSPSPSWSSGTTKRAKSKAMFPVVLDPAIGMDLPAALLKVSDMKDTALNDVAEEELDAALLDQLNIVYVAMTRPVERLDVLAETAKIEFDRTDPKTVSQWVLACAEDTSGKAFVANGDAIVHGANDRRSMDPSEQEQPSEAVVTTHLRLGEKAAQRVVMPVGHPSQVHPDGLDEASLGTLVHDLLAEVKEHSDWDPSSCPIQGPMDVE